jgi:tRNA(fMet)-specific endonuclease VapC
MAKYLLDTDICIFFLKGKFELVQKIDAIGIENCFISEITIAELWFGAERSSNFKKHSQEVLFMEQYFQVLPLSNVLRTYAKEKARLQSIGNIVAEFDLLIGATAIANNLIMVTRNQKHFSRIQNIQLENWTEKRDNEFL